jgi:transposase InsO family protein
MSATGNPYDNAKAESFFKTLKREEVYLKDYQTFAEAEANLGQFSTMSTTPSGFIQAWAINRQQTSKSLTLSQ